MPNQTNKTLLVSAIKNGTVIDHITAGQAVKILSILNLASQEKVVTMGINLPSKAMRSKDIIKIEDRELTNEEASIVALFAPGASINIIRNYEVVKKFNVKIPDSIEKVVVCPNPKCITNHEPMNTVFYVKPNGRELKLQCKYCEKTFMHKDIQEYKI